MNSSPYLRMVLAAAAAIYLIVVASAAIVGPRPGENKPDDLAAGTTPRPLPSVVGMTVTLYHVQDLDRVRDAIEHLHDLGFNALQVVTPIFQDDGSANTVQRIIGPDRGPTDEQILAVLAAARDHGMATSLMPRIQFTAPRGNEGRSKIQPDDWTAWWESYHKVMLGFADIAHRAEVTLLSVGCELNSAEDPRFEEQWAELIRDIRETHAGPLTYTANWDRYTQLPFWEQLDAIGVSGYWDLTANSRSTPPSDGDLARRWVAIYSQLTSFAEDTGRPVLIMELGYPAASWGLQEPRRAAGSASDEAPDPATQARGYRSFLEAFAEVLAGEDPRFAGVFFYKWGLGLTSDDVAERGYGIEGNPAEAELRAFLRDPARESDADR